MPYKHRVYLSCICRERLNLIFTILEFSKSTFYKVQISIMFIFLILYDHCMHCKMYLHLIEMSYLFKFKREETISNSTRFKIWGRYGSFIVGNETGAYIQFMRQGAYERFSSYHTIM